MPTYEYLCGKCGDKFEAFQSITATPLKSCPKCKGRVQRLISAGNGLIFKGSGFYITDYKNNGSNGSKDSQKSSTDSNKSGKSGREQAKATTGDSKKTETKSDSGK